jgi:7-carboxy-7-deazaguanine synthase
LKGQNPARSQEAGDGSSLWIQEVFYTLQGEGPFFGQPSVFIRLGGCNLRCFWCDTDFESSTWRPSLDELMGNVEELRGDGCDLVVLTGGEPFRQNIVPLVERCLANGLRVQIETNGTLWLPLPDDPRLTIVCSPKTPKLHPETSQRINAMKYVVKAGEQSAEDGLPMASTQVAGEEAWIARPEEGHQVYLMPLDEDDKDKNRRNLEAVVQTCLDYGYRLTVQGHKAWGVP